MPYLLRMPGVEESCSVDEIVQRGFDQGTVEKIIRMVDRNEYNRRQSPPGIKITPRAFGKDCGVCRLPIGIRAKHLDSYVLFQYLLSDFSSIEGAPTGQDCLL